MPFFIQIDQLSPVMMNYPPPNNCHHTFFGKKVEVSSSFYNGAREAVNFTIDEVDELTGNIPTYKSYFEHSVDLKVYRITETAKERVLYCELQDIAAYNNPSNGEPF